MVGISNSTARVTNQPRHRLGRIEQVCDTLQFGLAAPQQLKAIRVLILNGLIKCHRYPMALRLKIALLVANSMACDWRILIQPTEGT